ncbi:hypothetical protein [Streptomyces yaizuensis]|uniref:Uncharacterized protein n=1 Tax=Streptomyces yaizuensis TaxID=2989713 RepID=A0ABQ5NUQ5_9ACTN|nr:hypothetical protein [Streptomyces sp. YSPA8]GLF94093.1 hypothetical protein SYYSPA8_07370 [Streptomyces sp. YSPA8]
MATGADSGLARFLVRVGDVAFRAGPRGIELCRIDCEERHVTFRDAGDPDPRLPVFPVGPVPDDDEERKDWVWMPAAPSPAWAHLAWLVGELGDQFGALRDHGVRLVDVDIPGRAWADLGVTHGGERWRVRVALEGGAEPIEFPACFIGELFTERRHTRYLVPVAGNLVDLTDVL